MIQPYAFTGEVMPRDALEALEWLADEMLTPEASPWWDALRGQDVRDTITRWRSR